MWNTQLDTSSIVIAAHHNDTAEMITQTGMRAFQTTQACAAEGREVFLVLDQAVVSSEVSNKLAHAGFATMAWINQQPHANQELPDYPLIQAATTVVAAGQPKLMSSDLLPKAHKTLAMQGQTLLRNHEHLEDSENRAGAVGLEGRAHRLLRYHMQLQKSLLDEVGYRCH